MNSESRSVEPNQQRTAVLVLGMHRSGTSALTRVISLLGADLPANLMPPIRDNNESGFWESLDLYQLHDQMLAATGSSWDDWRKFDDDWLHSPEGESFQQRAADYLEKDFFQSSLFVLKDPRISRFVPFWKQVLETCGIRAVGVISLRHPEEVAASLHKRDDFSVEKSWMVWLRHQLDAEFATRGMPRCILSFDSLLDDWRSVAHKMARDLDIEWPSWSARTEQEINGFLKPGQRHHHVTKETAIERLPTWVQDAYLALLALADGKPGDEKERRATMERLDRIRTEFDHTSNALNSAFRDQQKDLDRLRQHQIALNQELTAMHGDLVNTNRRLAETEQQRTDLEKDLAKTNDKLSNTKDQLSNTKDQLHATEAERQWVIDRLTRFHTDSAPYLMPRHEGPGRRRRNPTQWYMEMRWMIWQGLRRELPVELGLRKKAHRLLEAGVFDEPWYLNTYHDVFDCPDRPVVHWLRSGWREGRDPNPLFDTNWFLKKYSGMMEADLDPLSFYIANANQDDLEPSPLFDTNKYQAKHPQWSSVSSTPLAHALSMALQQQSSTPHVSTGGLDEATAFFDQDYYLESNPDIAALGGDPLTHYIQYGRQEGRTAVPPAMEIHGGAQWDSNKTTVLVVTHDASRTGAPILALSLVKALKPRHNVILLALNVMESNGELLHDFTEAATLVATAKIGDARNEAIAGRYIQQLCEQYAISYALVNSIESRAVLQGLAREFIPAIIFIHEFAAYTRPVDALPYAALWAARMVFSSVLTRDNAQAFLKGYGIPEMTILPQGQCAVPMGKMDPLEIRQEQALIRQTFRPGDDWKDAIVVLGAGTVHYRKGVDLFIACAAKARSLCPGSRFRFVWIGHGLDPEKDIAYSVYLCDQIQRHGLQDIVIFMEPVTTIETAYQEADLFFMSSRLDPLPNVAIDCLVAGVPVICFNQGSGIAEFVRSNPITADCAVPYVDVAAAAEQICRLITDPMQRKQVAEATMEVGRINFKREDYIQKLEDLAEEVRPGLERERLDCGIIADSKLLLPEYVAVPGLPHQSTSQLIRRFVRSWASGISRRKPFPGFHPGVFAEQCSNDLEGRDPTAMFLEQGMPDGPWTHPVISPNGKPDATSGTSNTRCALHLHLHYADMAKQFLASLQRNERTVDLLISVPDENAQTEVAKQFGAYAGKVLDVLVCPNKGRDIGPLFTGFAQKIVDHYDVIGHMHSKRSIGSAGADSGSSWMSFLLANLLGNDDSMMDRILKAMEDDPKLGLIFPDDPYIVGWGENYQHAQQLAADMDLALPPEGAFNFPVGTMFWARSKALLPLFDLGLAWSDYPNEPLAYDGTVLHAIERLLPFVVESQGFSVATTYIADVTR